MPSVDAATVRELEAGGAPPEVLAHYRGRVGDGVFELCQAGCEAFQVFTTCRPQYETVGGMGSTRRIYNGLDRSEVAAVMEMLGVAHDRRAVVLRQVLWMERGAFEGSRPA